MASFEHNAAARRQCEYDSDTWEYWVNTRTHGSLSREDMETFSRTRAHEGEVGADELGAFPTLDVDLSVGGFSTLGASNLPKEGDQMLTVP